MRVTVLVISALTLCTCTVYGQSGGPTWVVKGCLVDRTNDDPLLFAKVAVHGTPDTTITDAQGCFTLALRSDPNKSRLYLRTDYLGFESYSARIKRKDVHRVRVCKHPLFRRSGL